MTRSIWMILATLLTAACAQTPTGESQGPRTDYLYEAPATDEGRRCVAACEKNKKYCQTAADKGSEDTYKRCEEQAHDEYENCTMRTTSFSEKRQCYRKSCPVSPDYVNCEATYRNCFVTCGGQVWSRQVCEPNC